VEEFDARDGVNPCVYAPYKGGLAGELSIFRNPWARHETKELAQGYIHVTGPPPISLVLRTQKHVLNRLTPLRGKEHGWFV